MGISTSVKFINHACFSFELNGESVLVDPWFEGTIFNKSWSLVNEGGNIPDNLKYIFITHEHPDHLHWLTLKKLANKNITVCLAKRRNSNVRDNLEKLGYKVLEFDNKVKENLKWFDAEFFNTGHDNAIVFKTKDLVILNQNDCCLHDSVAAEIKTKYPNIDIWWMQFSLAGYYGNLNDSEKLLDAQITHLNYFNKYKQIFKPEIAIPFASFVYFCREQNKVLNRFRVPLHTVINRNPGTQVLYMGDEVLFDNFHERSLENIEKWERDFKRPPLMEDPKGTVEDLTEVVTKFADKYGAAGSIPFDLYDSEEYCIIDFDRRKVTCEKTQNPIAKVTLYDLTEMFKNPWGADTMNITACFEVYDSERWRALLGAVDRMYER